VCKVGVVKESVCLTFNGFQVNKLDNPYLAHLAHQKIE